MKRLLLLVVAIAAFVACAPTDGHPIVHAPGQWPSVVVEDHTSAAWPVNGAFGPRWGIGGAFRGNCADHPASVCYRLLEGSTSASGGYTGWTYTAAGKVSCTTTFNQRNDAAPAAIREELVLHEIGHCYGLAHTAQGAGVMEPTVTGRYTYPTPDERDTMRRIYLG